MNKGTILMQLYIYTLNECMTPSSICSQIKYDHMSSISRGFARYYRIDRPLLNHPRLRIKIDYGIDLPVRRLQITIGEKAFISFPDAFADHPN